MDGMMGVWMDGFVDGWGDFGEHLMVISPTCVNKTDMRHEVKISKHRATSTSLVIGYCGFTPGQPWGLFV